MTHAEFTALIRFYTQNLETPPTVVTMGQFDFDMLRETMLASQAALVACREGEPWFETGKHLSRLGIQHFFLSGILVMRSRSQNTGIQIL